MKVRALNEDKQLRAMVTLIETQAEQIDALRRGVRDLEGRLALRSELDTIVAHEVRTPLTVIEGALSTMAQLEPGDARFDSLLDRAHGQALYLTDVVRDLLTPQGNGGPSVHRARLKSITLRFLVDRAVTAVSTRLPLDRIEVHVDEDLMVTTSSPRLTAIIVNLLENAARYGGDTAVSCAAFLDETGLLHVEIADRGPGLGGIDPEGLFDAFVQGENGHGDGRGVGLYLVRLLARSLGGDVTLADRPDGGCLASVLLPQRRSDDAPYRK